MPFNPADYLQKFGWQKGEGLGKEATGSVDFIKVVNKQNTEGIGHHFALPSTAWMDECDDAFKNVQVLIADSSDSESEVVFKRTEPSNKPVLVHDRFLRSSQVMTGKPETERSKTKKWKKKSVTPTPNEETSEVKMFEAGAPVIKARHMTGKLARLMLQDQLLRENKPLGDKNVAAVTANDVDVIPSLLTSEVPFSAPTAVLKRKKKKKKRLREGDSEDAKSKKKKKKAAKSTESTETQKEEKRKKKKRKTELQQAKVADKADPEPGSKTKKAKKKKKSKKEQAAAAAATNPGLLLDGTQKKPKKAKKVKKSKKSKKSKKARQQKEMCTESKASPACIPGNALGSSQEQGEDTQLQTGTTTKQRWESSAANNFEGDNARASKFLRLMGGAKQNANSTSSTMSGFRRSTSALDVGSLNASLSRTFEQGINKKFAGRPGMGKRAGLGFSVNQRKTF